MAVKISPKSEKSIIGSPNNNPPQTERYAINANANIVTNPESIRRLVPIIEIAKCLLLNEKIPAVKPNAKPKIPKISINTYNKPTALRRRIPMKRTTQEERADQPLEVVHI
jgi:hypothetical protein